VKNTLPIDSSLKEKTFFV